MCTPQREIINFCPGGSFPSVSVTGAFCAEGCEHCKGRYLEHMDCAMTDDALLAIAERVRGSGGKGVLISGGCDSGGRVPIHPHTAAIRKMADMGLAINVHAGFLTAEEAKDLVAAGVGHFLVDVHRDPEIIGSVLHLDRRPEEYAETLHAILDAGGAPVPHLTVGFGSRDLIGSAEAVKEAGLSRVVLLGLVPTPGTVFSSRSVSEAEMISAVDVLSGMGLEATLGCMRDRSHRSLERECILRGVKGIANMSRETLRWAERNGYSVSESRTCCCCAGPQNIESVFSERYP